MTVTGVYRFRPKTAVPGSLGLRIYEFQTFRFDTSGAFGTPISEILIADAAVPAGRVAVVLGLFVAAGAGGTSTGTSGYWRGTTVDGAGVHTVQATYAASRDGATPMLFGSQGDLLPLWAGLPLSRGIGVQAEGAVAGQTVRTIGTIQIGICEPLGVFS